MVRGTGKLRRSENGSPLRLVRETWAGKRLRFWPLDRTPGDSRTLDLGKSPRGFGAFSVEPCPLVGDSKGFSHKSLRENSSRIRATPVARLRCCLHQAAVVRVSLFVLR